MNEVFWGFVGLFGMLYFGGGMFGFVLLGFGEFMGFIFFGMVLLWLLGFRVFR